MTALVVGDNVTIACPICLTRMDPYRVTCGSECARELNWRKALALTKLRYQLDPESRLGKLAAEMDREEVRR
jgi:hypothetical protein